MKKLVLIADDDPDYLFQVKTMVEGFGYNVVEADGQKETERILQSVRPDLALIDLMMEEEDSGFILAFKIKKKFPELPIIIATGVTAETGMHFGLVEGEEKKWIMADMIMEKGMQADQLRAALEKLLQSPPSD